VYKTESHWLPFRLRDDSAMNFFHGDEFTWRFDQ
jgi:hypothetical protein